MKLKLIERRRQRRRQRNLENGERSAVLKWRSRSWKRKPGWQRYQSAHQK
jgi:hypothetical protein